MLGWVFVAVRGLSLASLHGLLVAVASLLEHGLQAHGLSSCGTWTYLLCSMWNLLGPGIDSVVTGPPEKSKKAYVLIDCDQTHRNLTLYLPSRSMVLCAPLIIRIS